MKYLLRNIACAILLLSLYNCTTEPVENSDQFLNVTESQDIELETSNVNTCSGESPKAKLSNNGTADVKFEIYDNNGTLLAEDHNVEIGTSSDWMTMIEGEITFVVVSNISGDKIVVVDVENCMEFELEVHSDNHVTYTVSDSGTD